MPLAASNPFHSRRLRPGAIDFIFAPGEGVGALLERLQENRWRGQIVGRHGTGKSTLLHALLRRVRSLGCRLTLGTFQGGRQHWEELPGEAADNVDVLNAPSRIVIIDGFEQLPLVARVRWIAGSRLLRHGLIVTTHRPVRLPELYRTEVTPELAQQVVEQLVGDGCCEFSMDEISAILDAHHGSMRDMLFAMYDRFESSR